MEFYGYKKCSTCRNAYKYLTERGVEVPFQDFVVNPPSRAALRSWVEKLGQGIEPFINQRGTRYKELGLKDQSLSEEEWIGLLAGDGKLLKRPVLVTEDAVVVGFKPDQYDHILAKR